MARPEEAFLEWLNATYSWTEANTWRILYPLFPGGAGWQTDPVYQYWEQWIRPQAQALSQERMGRAAERGRAFGQERQRETELTNLVEQVLNASGMTEKEAKTLLGKYWRADGAVSSIQFDPLFRKYAGEAGLELPDYLEYLGLPPEVKDYLKQWTTKADLSDRLNRITGLDDASKKDIYNKLTELTSASELAVRGAKGREQAGITKSWQAAQEKWAKESEVKQAAQLARANEVQQAVDYTRRNPLVTGKDLSATFAPGQGAIYGTADDWMNNAATADLMQDYITGKSDDFVNKLAKLNERVTTRGIGEEQVNLNLLASLERGKEQKEPWLRPLIPSARRVAEQFLAGTKLGEGTKLRSFIESEIPSLYEEVRAKREDWWRRMNPEPIEVETYEDVRDRLQAGANKWQAIAATAPTSEFTAQTVWGPGGLAGIARQAYEHAQKSISALKPGDFPTRTGLVPIKPEEDPLARALRERDFKARYYRQPRTGIVSRLQPSIRFR